MSARDAGAPDPDAGSGLGRTYLRVLVVEAIVLLVLYWMGRHFA
jgi:hypothetical protein